MARILLTWELGTGLGHLVGLAPLVSELLERGHQVSIALKDVSRAPLVLPDDRITLLQAPTKNRSTGDELPQAISFAHVLHNSGFSNDLDLRALATAWRNLFELVQPDLVLLEHSPSALLAARAIPARTVIVGTGFVCPPDLTPFPNLRFWQELDMAPVHADESRILERVNRLLRDWRLPTLEYLAQLYVQVDDTFLMTFQEMDHYPRRQGARYWGCSTQIPGAVPAWSGNRRKVFAYLKPMPQLPSLLRALRETGYDTLVYAPGLDVEVRKGLSCDALRFATTPVDTDAVGANCDVAVLNGTHGSAISMLRAGKPAIHVPIFLEQRIVTVLVQRLGAGRGLAREKPELLAMAVDEILSKPDYALAASRFADKYRGFNALAAAVEIADRLETLTKSDT